MIYPEMLDYAWVKDLGRVTAQSKYVVPDQNLPPVTADKLPKSPINLVMVMLEESLSYPEIIDVHTKGADPKRALHVLMWFDEYLLHKYGNLPDARMIVSRFVRRIANGTYTGLGDPRVKSDLLATPYVIPDDGESYKQPLPNTQNDQT
ncbi:MAG: hypothetical protein AAFY31_12520 [Pseudomonadota bacterium]